MSREVCRCSHHKDTHFEKQYTCTGVNCDCRVYRDASIPDDVKPHKDAHCPCAACYEWMQEYWQRNRKRA